MADRTYYRVETADYQIVIANAINAARCVRLPGAESSLVAVQPPQPAKAFFGILAAWHVNAVRFMVNEKRWLGGPPNPKNTLPVAPIPQAHYSSATYRKAIEIFVASLHRYGMIAVPMLGDNPCPYHWPLDSSTIYNAVGSEFSPCAAADQVMPDAANAPAVVRGDVHG